jgi:hypothetical protein
MRGTIRLLRFVQAPFGAVFWYFEQRIARIQDRIDNEKGGRK